MRCGCCGFLVDEGTLGAVDVAALSLPRSIASDAPALCAPVTPHTIDKT